MGVEKTVPRKAINKKTKKSIVFDEKKRKDFLTGFKKRKDERRKKWNEKVERDFLVGGVLHEFKVDTFIKQNLVTEF